MSQRRGILTGIVELGQYIAQSGLQATLANIEQFAWRSNIL